ncbi:sigma-54 dependent transcriptional regulator [Ascidiaceihabitans sp.]|uniref:sigma-54-dependent transcriptional regulator n=1 Tax=Ascidiaceihabitans sp. TaxID=1872644 RepID=UPI00329732B8
MTDQKVLIIDDDRLMRNSLVDLIEAAGWTTKALARATDAERWIDQFQPDVILSDVRMPETSGLDLLKSLNAAPPVVLISAHGDIPTAVDAMNNGAYSFVEKPFDPKRLLLILSHAAENYQMQQSNLRLKERLRELSGVDRILLGQSPQMHRLRDMIAMVAGANSAVLVRGETGTGKDLVARMIHDLSSRCDGPYVAVNAAQITAANLPHIVHKASGGTVLLDEIGACPPDVQPVLLRMIDTGEVLPVDQGGPEQVNLRIIAATNEDTDAAVKAGTLRADLMYRLDGFSINLPPLRERRDDIALLATRFRQEFATQYDCVPPPLEEDELSALMAHEWPGNVRELRNLMDRRVMMARHGMTVPQDTSQDTKPGDTHKTGLRTAVAAFERQMIGKALHAHAGRMEDVAHELGIGRRTLNEKIVKLGLDKNALL